jgi:micrococcal nuclease
MRAFLLALFASLICATAEAKPVVLWVQPTGVYDGDTFTFVNRDGLHEQVRLLGIDAPELAQPRWGRAAQLLVSELVWNRRVQLVIPRPARPRDAYGRLLALVYLDSVSVQQTLLMQGLAVANAYGENVPGFDMFELVMRNAKMRRVGIWSDPDFVDPQVWRKQKKQKDVK